MKRGVCCGGEEVSRTRKLEYFPPEGKPLPLISLLKVLWTVQWLAEFIISIMSLFSSTLYTGRPSLGCLLLLK